MTVHTLLYSLSYEFQMMREEGMVLGGGGTFGLLHVLFSVPNKPSFSPGQTESHVDACWTICPLLGSICDHFDQVQINMQAGQVFHYLPT